jgi:hypothetical protein
MTAIQVIHVEARSAASRPAVWQLLADVTTWTDWAQFDEATYERDGDHAPHGLGAVRRLRVGPLSSRERVLRFEPPHRFAYDYDGTLPLRTYRADVTLTPDGDGTIIHWHSEFTPKIPFTGWLLRRMLTRVLTDLSERLAQAAAPSLTT